MNNIYLLIILLILIVLLLSIKSGFGEFLQYDDYEGTFNKFTELYEGYDIFTINNSPNLFIEYTTPSTSKQLYKYPILSIIESGNTGNNNNNILDSTKLYSDPEKYFELISGDPTSGNQTVKYKLYGSKEIFIKPIVINYTIYYITSLSIKTLEGGVSSSISKTIYFDKNHITSDGTNAINSVDISLS
jgi:hypothetical protein